MKYEKETQMKLRELKTTDGMDVYQMLQRIGPAENEFHNDVNGMTISEYQKWLEKQHAWSLGNELPAGYVKQWTYWLTNDEGKPIGYGKLREKATEESRKFGGNIGYAIDPVERGKGYGKLLFQLLLVQAKERNIKEVFSTVEKFNYPSKRVHEECGGKLVKEDEDRWYFIFDIDDVAVK